MTEVAAAADAAAEVAALEDAVTEVLPVASDAVPEVAPAVALPPHGGSLLSPMLTVQNRVPDTYPHPEGLSSSTRLPRP